MISGLLSPKTSFFNGAVAETESREDAQADIVFLHIGILFTNLGKTVIVDGVERPFYLAPFMRSEVDERIAALVELLQHFRPFEDKAVF